MRGILVWGRGGDSCVCVVTSFWSFSLAVGVIELFDLGPRVCWGGGCYPSGKVWG